jgi:streptomycin 6-kinase
VAPAHDAAGRDAVLKVAWRHWEARDEAAGMAAWAGAGAAEVFAVDDRPPPSSVAGGGGDGGTTALLLERCRPGTPLTALPVDEQHVVVGALLRQLHGAPLADGHGFRSLTSMCDAWGASAERGHAEHPGALDAGLVREGLRLWHDLPRDLPSGVREALLVTDLHAANVLAAGREPWLLVDPKPHVGDPHYDVVQHLLNCEAELRADPAGLARGVAGEADLDGDRVVRWLFARCVQECWEWADLRPVARRLAADAAVS